MQYLVRVGRPTGIVRPVSGGFRKHDHIRLQSLQKSKQSLLNLSQLGQAIKALRKNPDNVDSNCS